MDIIIIVLLLVAIWYLAQLTVWLCASIGIFWITPKEGTAVAIMRNKKFHKMLLRYTGHHFKSQRSAYKPSENNLDGYEIEQEEISEEISMFTSIVFPIRGVSWIGIPPFYSVYSYKFKWMDDRFVMRDPEEIEWILVQKYVYGLVLDNIELEGGIPYTIKLLITLQVTNPAKALFRVKRWLDATMERVSGWSRDEFSTLSIDDFVVAEGDREMAESEGHAGPRLERALKRIMNSAEKDIEPEFGIDISIVQVVEIDPANDEMRKIIIQREVAKQQAAAVIEKAKGEAEAINIVNAAAEKMSDKAMMLKGFHAIENAGANVTLIGKDLNLPSMLQIPTSNKEGGAK
ncbi:MAG TPA: hypothetical protein DCS23_02320 [Candidatus Yonathbacteria bacterium]|nr:hypothetical protein [Candidatus Yonathbacteria bacterium]